MLESAWLFVGAVGVLATGVGVLTTDRVIAMVCGAVGFVAFSVWTYGTLDVVVVGDAATYSFSMPALTFFGVMLLLPPAWLLLMGPFGVVERHRDPDASDL